MRVNNNIPALLAHNAYSATQANIEKTIQKLSTGLRINSAADDAAGLGISEKMRSQMKGLAQASRNAQDGISMIQTAEGALQEVHSMLQRMRELAVQAANDTLTSQDRAFIQTEIDKLRDGIDRIAGTTQFNRRRLLDGSASALWSSDKLSTEAIIRGGLTSRDQFGQRVTAEGNFRIEISARPGQAQVLKSNIYTISRDTMGYWRYSTAMLREALTETFWTGLNLSYTYVDNNNYGGILQSGGCSHIRVTGLSGGLNKV